MPKINWHVRGSQLTVFRKYCKKESSILHEAPGYVFRRLIFFLSKLLAAEISLQQIEAGISLLLDMHRGGCCCINAKSRIKDIISLLKDD